MRASTGSARGINLELFPCSGGMAEGFRRAGVAFDLAIEIDPDHCDSYEANLGHRPVQMDVRDFLRLVKLGARPVVDLLVADPPCTPWSRAGRRLGQEDERDMLAVTCELIALLQPRRYLIGNIPGLDDGCNLPVVQRTIGALAAHGYCTADYLRLDAADFGVPQRRIRPFWFGHREGPCLRAPQPTHADPDTIVPQQTTMLGVEPLLPWVTCRQALGHLAGKDLGKPVRMRHRGQNGTAARTASSGRHRAPVHTSEMDAPARAITTQCRAPGHASTLVLNERHAPATLDAPAPTLGARSRGQGGEILSVEPRNKRPPSTQGCQSERVMRADAPATTVQARTDRLGSGSPVLEWPWDRPATTVTSRPGLAPPGHHDESFAVMSLPDAIQLSERAAAILQGFPDPGQPGGGWKFCGAMKKARWSQLGQAMPPALAEAVARVVVEQDLQRERELPVRNHVLDQEERATRENGPGALELELSASAQDLGAVAAPDLGVAVQSHGSLHDRHEVTSPGRSPGARDPRPRQRERAAARRSDP